MNQQTFTPESGAGDRTARPGPRLARAVVAAGAAVLLALALGGPASASPGIDGSPDAPATDLASVLELRALDPEVSAPSAMGADETIALSASSSLISLVGVLVLAAGVVGAAIAVEARSRDEAEGDLLGRA